MAKARMIHNKISRSTQVDNLPIPVRLLFTWMITHADDEGRMLGSAKYIKAAVIPYFNWSLKKVDKCIDLIKEQQLIYRWKQDNEWYIEFPKWKQHQKIQSDRFKPSELPSFSRNLGSNLDPKDIHIGSVSDPQYSVIQSNKKESSPKDGYAIPAKFTPKDEIERIAFEAWNELEHDNPMTLEFRYLRALKNKLPINEFILIVNEIKEEKLSQIENAKLFDLKVKDYFTKHEDRI